MMPRLRDRVTILPAETAESEDSHGNPVVDWDAATPVENVPAAVSPVTRMSASLEDTVGQDTVISRKLLVLYPDAALTFRDRVVWRGDPYEVDGDVEMHTDRSARPHHQEAFLRRVQG